MTDKDRAAEAAAATDTPGAPVPDAAVRAADAYPALWAALQRVGEEVACAGPLDARSRRIVHLAFALASGSEGAAHSHARRALEEGIAAEELEHLAMLGVTTLGWPQAVRGLTWVKDVTRSQTP